MKSFDDKLIQLVGEVAADFGIHQALVLGFIEVESAGETEAINPEPPYRYMWDVGKNHAFRPLEAEEVKSERPPDDFTAPAGVPKDAEWWLQQVSLGLMQVMGGTARWMGFDGKWLTTLLTDPETNLNIGCSYLGYQLKRYGGNTEQAVAAYNAGRARYVVDKAPREFRNQAYVDKVMAASRRWQAKLKEQEDA